MIEVGGRRVLHVGDAEQDPEIFASLDLPSRDLDVALVPYWYLRTKSGRIFLDEMEISEEEFRSAVQDAMGDLPERIAAATEEVAVVVDEQYLVSSVANGGLIGMVEFVAIDDNP